MSFMVPSAERPLPLRHSRVHYISDRAGEHSQPLSRAVLAVTVKQRPHPRQAHGRGGGLHDPPDHDAVGDNVVVVAVVAPFAPRVGLPAYRRACD
jgi:hypothetical protein